MKTTRSMTVTVGRYTKPFEKGQDVSGESAEVIARLRRAGALPVAAPVGRPVPDAPTDPLLSMSREELAAYAKASPHAKAIKILARDDAAGVLAKIRVAEGSAA